MEKPAETFARARRTIPGGVNSPVRAFSAVGGTPVFVESGEGAHIRTSDGRTLTDWCCSWGAMILGHGHPAIVAALRARAPKGTTFGIATPDEVAFAERLCAAVPGMDMVRAVNSGTEAVMTAVRLARGATGRDKILKFDGCYHGHSDALLVKSGSGTLTLGISGTAAAPAASSKGVPAGAVRDTLTAPYNDVAAVERVFDAFGGEIAAAIVEPVAGNMGLVPPEPGFLRALRALTEKHGALLVCDEVIDGFRFGFSSYSALSGEAEPDIITLGKIIGGGLPLAAVGGRRDIMRLLAPEGPVYQAGTLSGNPLAVAAGLAALETLEHDNPYARLAAVGARIAEGMARTAAARGVPVSCANLGGVFTPFCTGGRVRDLSGAMRCDTALYAKIFHGLLDRGHYIAPSQFECNFVSAAHSADDAESLLRAFDETVAEIVNAGGR